jgi:hypothetical protein
MVGIGIIHSSIISVVGYIAYGFEKNSVKPGRCLVEMFKFLLLPDFFVRQTYDIRLCRCGSGACDE